MEYQDYYDKFYHKVTGVTGVCVYKTALHGEEYPLEIGQTYNVRYLAMFRSCSRVVLENDRREYQSHCFKLYENGKPLEITAERFTAPYLRDWHIEDEFRFNKIPKCLEIITKEYPSVKATHGTKVYLGKAMHTLGFESTDCGHVAHYKVIPLNAA